MKKKRITYGVTGMMEYQTVIKIGRSQMKVSFTDGSATGYGTNPAMYTTDNLMIQKAIENSEQFKRSRIHIVESADLDEEVSVIRNVKKKEVPTTHEAHVDGNVENPAVAEDKPANEEVEKLASTGKKAMTEMEFDNNDDAKDYLEQTFGCVRSKLRNRQDIITTGKANGIDISFS